MQTCRDWYRSKAALFIRALCRALAVHSLRADCARAHLAGARSGHEREQAVEQDGGVAAGGRDAHHGGEDVVLAHGF